jgi:nicotinamidase-related amidase
MSTQKRRSILPAVVVASFLALAGGFATARVAVAADEPPVPVRPKVPGTLRLHLRERKSGPDQKEAQVVERTVDWDVAKTAIIICDMWDDIYCKAAARRIGIMAPRMNAVLSAARDHGVMVIHAPSGTMDLYEGTPFRRRMREAPKTEPPVPIKASFERDAEREPELPIDVSKSACDDPVVGPVVRRYTREHPALDITGYDGVSDDGGEIYNFCAANGITNIVLMGVHANMCVLGRSFGVRQLTREGFNVVVARDLTDAMYDPRQPPYVSHARGTEMVIEHIERYWCPTIVGEKDLISVVPGSAGPKE